jgi:hypothetical protein
MVAETGTFHRDLLCPQGIKLHGMSTDDRRPRIGAYNHLKETGNGMRNARGSCGQLAPPELVVGPQFHHT